MTALLEIARKRPLVCATIFSKDRSSFLRAAKKAFLLGCDLVELRVDHLSAKGKTEISEIISNCPLPTLATVRSKNDGGMFASKDERGRLQLLEAVIESSPAFVDIELSIRSAIRSRLLEKAREQHVGVVLSHHDMRCTPSLPELSRLAKSEFRNNPDIAKLVFQPKNNNDVSRILQVASLLSSTKRLYAIFGMGELGRVTRLASLLLGARLVYCSIGRTSGKLGQIEAKRVTSFIRNIEHKDWKRGKNDSFRVLQALQAGAIDEIYPGSELVPYRHTKGFWAISDGSKKKFPLDPVDG